MMAGIVIGLALGWLVAGMVVLSTAFRSELAGEPIRASDIPVIVGGLVLWPYLLFAEEGDDA